MTSPVFRYLTLSLAFGLTFMVFGLFIRQVWFGATMSWDLHGEAKKITATFEDQPFTPPPRTVNDILEILNQEKPEDLESYQKALDLAESNPPPTKDAKKLTEFYWNRALAGRVCGCNGSGAGSQPVANASKHPIDRISTCRGRTGRDRSTTVRP